LYAYRILGPRLRSFASVSPLSSTASDHQLTLSSLFYLKGQGIRRLSKHGREADDLGQMMRSAAQKNKGDAEK
jgi:hypothetical protein